MMRFAAVLLLWCAGLGLACADDVFKHPLTAEQAMNEVLPQAAKPMRDAKAVRGEFVYRKFLPEIPTPLESSGEYLFVRELGMVWHTQKPFDSEFMITLKGIRQRDAGKSVAGADSPAMRTAARIFLSLLSLDMQALRSTFDLYGVKEGGRWQLGLRPVGSAVAAVFREGVISGGEQVEKVALQDANGDRTEILFKNTRYEQTTPGPQDQRRFEP